MLERRRARHQALHILYQREITDESLSGILATGTYSGEDGEPSDFCRELLMGVESHQSTIDATIESISENWTLSRMPLVDRNILRIAVYEIEGDTVPYEVAINEAVELAKRYTTDEAARLVNGALGKIAREGGSE